MSKLKSKLLKLKTEKKDKKVTWNVKTQQSTADLIKDVADLLNITQTELFQNIIDEANLQDIKEELEAEILKNGSEKEITTMIDKKEANKTHTAIASDDI